MEFIQVMGFLFFSPDEPVENRRDENHRSNNRGYCHGCLSFWRHSEGVLSPQHTGGKAEPANVTPPACNLDLL